MNAALAGTCTDCLSARLLMLPLSVSLCERLELASASQTDDMAHFYKLYPEVSVEAVAESLRVQLKLLQAAN